MKKNEYILITGGLGYLGSHAVVKLLNKNKNIIVIDNLSNSKIRVKNNIEKITKKKFIFFKLDIRDKKIDKIFINYKITKVIHFAGLKSIKESELKVYNYFSNNFNGSSNLLEVMEKFNCRKIIFSSSACVYDEKNNLPFKENSKISPKSIYGLTKYSVELLLKSKFKFEKKPWSIIVLRYFNPIGSHSSGLINEDPTKLENIIPKLVYAIKNKKFFKINGANYPTKDGTCYRDYIHIDDLIDAHLSALKCLNTKMYEIINIGSGKCHSVKDLIAQFSKIMNYKIKYKIVSRRKGDIPISYASSTKSLKKLKWKTKKNIYRMCQDIVRVI